VPEPLTVEEAAEGMLDAARQFRRTAEGVASRQPDPKARSLVLEWADWVDDETERTVGRRP
jgi:hypothetical protein